MDVDSGRHLSKFPRWKVSVSWSADDRCWRNAATRRLGKPELRRRAFARRRRVALAGSLSLLLSRQANQVLSQEIERDGEQYDVLHQEGDVSSHRGESSCSDVPAFRHERNDGDRRDKGAGRTEGAKNA